MSDIALVQPVDYLVIGHVAHDLTPEGPRLGGTASYSATILPASKSLSRQTVDGDVLVPSPVTVIDRAAREERSMKVRQPLARMVCVAPGADFCKLPLAAWQGVFDLNLVAGANLGQAIQYRFI